MFQLAGYAASQIIFDFWPNFIFFYVQINILTLCYIFLDIVLLSWEISALSLKKKNLVLYIF